MNRIIQTLQKLRKIGTTTIICNLLFLVPYCLVSLPRRRFRIQQILREWRKIVVKTTFRYCFVLFSLTREGLRIQLSRRKVPKIVLFPHFPIFPYVFITKQNHRCKVHYPCIAFNLKAVLSVVLNTATVVTFQRVI